MYRAKTRLVIYQNANIIDESEWMGVDITPWEYLYTSSDT